MDGDSRNRLTVVVHMTNALSHPLPTLEKKYFHKVIQGSDLTELADVDLAGGETHHILLFQVESLDAAAFQVTNETATHSEKFIHAQFLCVRRMFSPQMCTFCFKTLFLFSSLREI